MCAYEATADRLNKAVFRTRERREVFFYVMSPWAICCFEIPVLFDSSIDRVCNDTKFCGVS